MHAFLGLAYNRRQHPCSKLQLRLSPFRLANGFVAGELPMTSSARAGAKQCVGWGGMSSELQAYGSLQKIHSCSQRSETCLEVLAAFCSCLMRSPIPANDVAPLQQKKAIRGLMKVCSSVMLRYAAFASSWGDETHFSLQACRRLGFVYPS